MSKGWGRRPDARNDAARKTITNARPMFSLPDENWQLCRLSI